MTKDSPLVLGIDQGTTGTTVVLFDVDEHVSGRGYREIPQRFPAPGQVEHDPEAIWRSVLDAMAEAQASCPGREIGAVGITNQRETVVLWDRASGRPVAPVIVWQDRRTAVVCEALRRAGHEPRVQELTGLVIDPYFSATKIAWLLDNIVGLRMRAEAGEIAFGTIDSFLMWRLSGGRAHVTDVTNASRTSLLDLRTCTWSDELCALFRVPRAILPTVRPSLGTLAITHDVAGLADGTPITGCAGDQQAALFGQGCYQPGDTKCTFGTGSFLLMNVGDAPVISRHRLVTTVAWKARDQVFYALEGSVFISGALVQWLRDGLGIIREASEIETLAASVVDSGEVVIVPALTGLGAPHWRAEARGLITGITRGTTRAHIARAALEAMALGNVEIVRAMEQDAGQKISALRVDGGATANNLLMQIQADFLGVEIIRPSFIELTALGAARMAAQGAGLIPAGGAPPKDLAASSVFRPRMTDRERRTVLERWKVAVAKA